MKQSIRVLATGLSLSCAAFAVQTTSSLLGFPSQSTDFARAQIIKNQLGASSTETVEQKIDSIRRSISSNASTVSQGVESVRKLLRSSTDSLRQQLTRSLTILQTQNSTITDELKEEIEQIQKQIDLLAPALNTNDLFSIISQLNTKVGGKSGEDLITRLHNIQLFIDGQSSSDIITSLIKFQNILDPNPANAFTFNQSKTTNLLEKLNRSNDNLGGTGAGILGRTALLKSLLNKKSTLDMYSIINELMGRVGGFSQDMSTRLDALSKLVNGMDGTSLTNSLEAISQNIGLGQGENLQTVLPDIITKISSTTGVQGTLMSIVDKFSQALNQRIGISGSNTQEKLNRVFSQLQGQGNVGGDLQTIINSVNNNLSGNTLKGTTNLLLDAQDMLRQGSSGLGNVLDRIILSLQSTVKRQIGGLTLLDLLTDAQAGIFSLTGGSAFDGVSYSLFENLSNLRTLVDPTAGNSTLYELLVNNFNDVLGGNSYSSTNGLYQNLRNMSLLLKGQAKSTSQTDITNFIRVNMFGLMGGQPFSTTTSPFNGVYDSLQLIHDAVTGRTSDISSNTIIDSLNRVQSLLWNNLSGSQASSGNIYSDLTSLNRLFEYANGGKSLAEILFTDISPLLKCGFANGEGVYEILVQIMQNLNPQSSLNLFELTGSASNSNSIPYLIGGGTNTVSIYKRLKDVQSFLRNGSTSSLQTIVTQDMNDIIGGASIVSGVNSLFDNLFNISNQLKNYPFMGTSSNITTLVGQASKMLTDELTGISGINSSSLSLPQATSSVKGVLGYGSNKSLMNQIVGSAINDSVLADLNLNSTRDVKTAINRLRNFIGNEYTESSIQNMLISKLATSGVKGHLEGNGPNGNSSASIHDAIQNIRTLLGYINYGTNLLDNVSNKNANRGIVGDLVGGSLVNGNTVSANINAIKRAISPAVNGYTSANVYDLITKESVTSGVLGDLGVPTESAQTVKEAITFLRNRLDQGSIQGIRGIIQSIQGLMGYPQDDDSCFGGNGTDMKQTVVAIRNYLSNHPTQTVIDRITNIKGLLSVSTTDDIEVRIKNILMTLHANQSGVVANVLTDIYDRVGDSPDCGSQSILDNVKAVQDKIGVGDTTTNPNSVFSGLNNFGELIKTGFTASGETLVQSITEFNQYLGTPTTYDALNFGNMFYSGGFTLTSQTLSRAIGTNQDDITNDTLYGYMNGINTQVQTLKGSGSATYTKVTIDLPESGFTNTTILDFLGDIYTKLSTGVAS